MCIHEKARAAAFEERLKSQLFCAGVWKITPKTAWEYYGKYTKMTYLPKTYCKWYFEMLG